MPAKDSHKPIEKGDIYFFYRPKVMKASASDSQIEPSIEKTHRFYIVLKGAGSRYWRLLIMGKKMMPEYNDVEFGFVYQIKENADDLTQYLEEERYSTATRGERKLPTARPIAEGKYFLWPHERHTHLVYRLEQPQNIGQVQKEYHLANEGNYIVTVKNPEQSSNIGLTSDQKAQFSKQLQEKFGKRRFIALDTAEFLDYPGAEFLLIGEKTQPKEKSDIDIEGQFSRFPHYDVRQALDLEKNNTPIATLFGNKESTK